MTYCLGILTLSGLVIAADSRTNAGVDYVSTAQKLFDFSIPHERVVLLCTAGNLSLTQSVLTLIQKDLKVQSERNVHTIPSMYEIAQYVGQLIRQVSDEHRDWLKRDGIEAQFSFILGGQVKGEATELYMLYSQGNFLRATKETPYLQIGEIKYGKPILDRVIQYETTSLDEAVKCSLLSIDSTMKSNISVGPPINVVMYEADSFQIKYRLKFTEGDDYLGQIRLSWESSLRQAFQNLPDLPWMTDALETETANWLSPRNVYTT
jgi:putative proteasome-type protease